MMEPSNRRAAVCAYVKTVVTTTTLSKNERSDQILAQVIAQLQKTRLSFSKLSQLQRKRVRNLQRRLRKKNSLISALSKRLGAPGRATRHFSVTLCKNVFYTTSGSEQFVRRRAARLCAAGGEQLFCARRADVAGDRRRLAEALTTSLGAGVTTGADNKRFAVEDAAHLASAKLVVQQVLHDAAHSNARAD